MTKFLLVSAASWLLIAVLTNIDGNAMPILFKFQQYFLSCAMFGLGLGFFQEGRAVRDGATAESSDMSPTAESSDMSPTAESSNISATAEKDEPELPLKNDTNRSAAAGKLGSGWAIWLSVVATVLLFVTGIKCPGGLPNAISMALQNESTDVFASEFYKGWLFTDIISLGLVGTMLFAWVQIFVAPGRELKRLFRTNSGAQALCAFAGGGALSWALYALLALLSAPPPVMLIVSCLVFLSLSSKRKVCAFFSAFAVICCLYMGSVGLAGRAPVAEQYKKMTTCFWANGSRIDTMPLLNKTKLLGFSVWIDRVLYQLLPASDLTEDDAKSLLKQCGLPEFSINYRQLPYRAMSNMKGKFALILGAGIGSEVAECLNQGLAHITAVEPQRWLTEIESHQSSSFHLNPAVTLSVIAPRQFLRHTKDSYDLIFYTGHSAVNRPNPFIAINHDDYLFTAESFFDGFTHLKPGGELVIVTPAGNDLVRVRMAANLLAINGKIDAELTTPYGNYLIAENTASQTGPANDIVEKLRQQVGSKIVNHESWLVNRAKRAIPTSDNRPFTAGWAPMIPLADSFFMVLMILAMVCSLRLHVPQSMLQNVTRQKCRAFVLGAMFMLLMCKACMIVSFEFGTTPPVIYLSIISGWMLAVVAGALCARQCRLNSFGLPNWTLPGWVVWTFFMIALASDCAFNYELACWLPNALMRFAASALLPWSPAFMAAWLLCREIMQGPGECFGLSLIGFSFGCLLGLSVMFNGIASLDLLAAGLAFSVLLLIFWPSSGSKKIGVPVN
jgi:hypothetical protein